MNEDYKYLLDIDTEINMYKLINKLKSIPIEEWKDTCIGSSITHMFWLEQIGSYCKRKPMKIEIFRKSNNVFTIVLDIKEKCNISIEGVLINEDHQFHLETLWNKYFKLKEWKTFKEYEKRVNEMIDKFLGEKLK